MSNSALDAFVNKQNYSGVYLHPWAEEIYRY